MSHPTAEAPASESRRSGVFRLNFTPSGPLRRRLFEAAGPLVERILGLTRLQRYYDRMPEGCGSLDFLRWSLDVLDVRVAVGERDLERIPERGPAVIVANHPFGAIEGMALALLLQSRRSDVKIMANYQLGRIPELRDLFLLVDPFDTRTSVRRNLAPLRRAVRWVADGGMLVVFPAGEVAHVNLRRRRVEDPPWSPAVATIVRRARCPVVPVYFSGRNGALFQALGILHPRLRTALLARALLARRGRKIEARTGSPIPFRQIETFDSDAEMVEYLRSRTYILSRRSPDVSAAGRPVQPRMTPRDVQPVIPPAPSRDLAREIGRLPADQRLVDSGGQAVYVAEADQIPQILREIGRLREISFRRVGEGTGRELDLDVFDSAYRHLFIWSHTEGEVVGAYRLGLTDEILHSKGLNGLYTSTLFDFRLRLFESMGPALEMGRSFIRPEHQKSYAPLMLLWKGIGQYVLRHPRYATLFGPVSISAGYQSASQQLIVAFLEQNKYAHDWSRWVKPHAPCPADRSGSYRLSPARLRDLADVSTFIAEIEADQKGVPILLKQYLKLGGRLLGFNVDPDFSNVLDVLIMVDLRRTEPKILARYMGRQGVTAFRAWHADSHPAAS